MPRGFTGTAKCSLIPALPRYPTILEQNYQNRVQKSGKTVQRNQHLKTVASLTERHYFL